MSKRPLNDYFEKARKLPLATSYASIEKLVSLKGVSMAPPKKWWWNLNTLIIMSTIASLIALTSIYALIPSNTPQYESRMVEPLLVEERTETLIAPNFFSVRNEERTAPIENKYEVVEKNDLIANNDPIWENADQPIVMEEMEVDSSFFEKEPEAEELPETSTTSEPLRIDSTQTSSDSYEGGKKNLQKNLSAEGVKTFKLKNSKGDINIHAWDKNEIEIQVEAKIKTKKKENQNIALEDFELELVNSGGIVEVESNWEDIFSCMCSGDSKKDQIKTENGDRIKVKELNLAYDVYLPNSIALELSNSYAGISMPDWNADLNVRVFHADLNGGNVQDLEVSNSYGKINLGDFQKVNGKLFQAEMTLGNGDAVDLSANYSTLNVGQVKTTDLAAFQSNASFKGISDRLSTNFRYGKLSIEQAMKEAVIKAFQSKVYADNIDKLNANFSYSRLEAKDVVEFRIENAFQSNIELNRVGEVSGSLRYTPFKMVSLNELLDLSTFQGRLSIDEVNPQFRELKLDSRYTDLDLKIGENSSYKMRLVSNYTSLNIPDFENSVSSLGSSRKEINTVHNPKGESEVISAMDLSLFQGSLKLEN